MQVWVRKWWRVFKALLAVAILAAVGRQLARDLQRPDLWQLSLRPGWLALASGLYVGGIGLSALYWYRLLCEVGQVPARTAVARAYYIGHLGKYLPGKAWALLLRVSLVQGAHVRPGAAVLTSLYEVLTTMAGGVLLAAVLFAVLAPDRSAAVDWEHLRGLLTLQASEAALDRKVLVLLALTLLGPTLVPILPPVFNRVVYRLGSLRAVLARRPDGGVRPGSLPRVRLGSLFEGLLLTACGWALLGASLAAVLQGVLPEPPSWDAQAWGRYTAWTAVAYVAGFLILVVPGGLGVREYFLTLFLLPELAASGSGTEGRALAVLAVLVLRLVWTVAELVVAAMVYWLPGPALHLEEL